MIIENIPISRPNNVVKKDWSVGRRASFSSEFCSDSTLLFRIQKNHYMAIYFWKNDCYTYYYDHIVNHMVPDLYIHLGQVIFHTNEFFFHFLPLPWTWALPFCFSKISRIFTNSHRPGFFFYYYYSFPGIDDHLIFPFILPPTTFIAFSFVCQSSSLFPYSKVWERLVCFFLL